MANSGYYAPKMGTHKENGARRANLGRKGQLTAKTTRGEADLKKIKPGDSEVFLRLMQIADAPHSLEAMQYIVFQFDFHDYEQFIIEAPPGSIRFNNLIRVAQFYDGLGVLVEAGVVDPEVAFELFPVPWNKVEPIVQGMRRELEWPDMFDHFEALAKQYRRWWDEKRKRLKLAGEAPPPVAKPRAVTVPRPAPAARPATPGAPRPGAPGRPAMVGPARPGAPAMGLARRPGVLAGSPVARPVARPGPGQRPSKPKIARPTGRKTLRPAAKGKGKSGRKR